MIAQVIFLFLLQGIGILFGLAFRKRLPFTFIWISGLLWGCLFWVLGSLGLLILRLPYSRLSLGILCAVFLIALVIWNQTRHNFEFSKIEGRTLLVWLAVSLAIFLLASYFNLTVVSPDSLIMILNGQSFASQGFSPFIRNELALRGFFVQALQAAGPLLGLDYLYALQPALISISLVLYVYLSGYMLSRQGLSRPSFWVQATLLLGMLSTYFFIFQAFYIHTNLLSGMYLMVALGCFWLALKDKNSAWIISGTLALTAFSLLRTEAPLFSLLFLALLFHYQDTTYRTRLAVTLPFTIFFSAWYLYLLAGAGSQSYILSPANILVMIAALLGFSIFVVTSRLDWVQSRLLPRLPYLLFLGLFGLCAILFAVNPGRMLLFLKSLILNASVYGMWGVSWLLIAAGLLLAVALPSFPFERLFSVGIPAFFILLYAISTLNVNSQLDWGDSANRMLSHIFPTCFLYLSIKLHLALNPAGMDIHPGRGKRPLVLSAIGMGLMVFSIVLMLTR